MGFGGFRSASKHKGRQSPAAANRPAGLALRPDGLMLDEVEAALRPLAEERGGQTATAVLGARSADAATLTNAARILPVAQRG